MLNRRALVCGIGDRDFHLQDQGAGGLVQIQFQSGGKAISTVGAMIDNCTYTVNNKTIALTCDNITTNLTINSDGSLSGPPDGMLARMTRVK